MINDRYSVENNGDNYGVVVANNSGNIYFSLQKVVKTPALISCVIKMLGNACIGETYSNVGTKLQEYKPDEKITYNGVIVYRDIIREFSAYYLSCDNYLNVYDNSNMGGKAKILRWVHMKYLYAKGVVLSLNKNVAKSEIDIIRENSDKIIDMVKEQISLVVQNSEEIEDICQEDLELGITCFTCYCFMECKILEKPL